LSRETDSKRSTESVEDRLSLISIRIQMLAAVFNRKTSDEMVRVYKDALQGYPMTVLGKAFTFAEQTLERFPTPKVMRSLANEAMPSEAWRYRYRKAESNDPETGMIVPVLIDPVNGDELFRMSDCPEGRAFQKKLLENSASERKAP